MRRAFLVCVLLMIVGLFGCSSGTSSPGSGKEYKGTFTGAGGDGGSLVITVSSAAAGPQPQDLHPQTLQNVTGTAYVGGSTVTLSGTFDTTTGKLTLSGGGYNFTATADANNGYTGTYTGPKGAGAFTVLPANGATAYCGTFAGGATGVWNFVSSNGAVSGSYTDSKGSTGSLTGTVSGANVNLKPSSSGTATGTIAGDTASGTWSNGGTTGTWTGSSTACGK